jgi:hypothetical protein
MELLKRINAALATARYYRDISQRYSERSEPIPHEGWSAPELHAAPAADAVDEQLPLAA